MTTEYGDLFSDVANAAMYAAEGNYKEAAKCLIFAIPGMDLAGKGAKYIASGSKVGKVVGSTLNVVDKTGKVLAITVSAYDFGNQAAYMIDKYMVNGEPVSWETVYETLILCSTGFQVTQFTKMAIEPVNTSHVSENAPEYGVVEDSAIENIAYDKSNVTYDDYPGGERIDACSPKGGAKSGIGCFTAGTKVKTSDGEKNIEDIEVGDEVYAYDVQTGETGVKKVVRTYIHDAEKLVYVTVDGETIEATTNHPFYVEGYGFRQAEDLKPGYILILLDGSRKYVEDIHIEELSEAIKVYNFEVEDWHTYFVGEQGVLVHNNCGETIPEGGSGSNTPSANTTVISHGETKASQQIKTTDVTDYWDNFLGSNQTNINPRTGQVDADRIFSADGTRSIRFGNHEMNSMGTTKFHFHEETWIYDPIADEMHYYNKLIRIKE